jgi:hypothetical protein
MKRSPPQAPAWPWWRRSSSWSALIAERLADGPARAGAAHCGCRRRLRERPGLAHRVGRRAGRRRAAAHARQRRPRMPDRRRGAARPGAHGRLGRVRARLHVRQRVQQRLQASHGRRSHAPPGHRLIGRGTSTTVSRTTPGNVRHAICSFRVQPDEYVQPPEPQRMRRGGSSCPRILSSAALPSVSSAWRVSSGSRSGWVDQASSVISTTT